MIIGLDIGYGWTKVTAGRELVSFPSIIGPAVTIRYHNDLIRNGRGHALALDGSEWFTGDLAALQSPFTISPRARERADTVLRVLALDALERLGARNEVRMVTGLPVSWYEDRGQLSDCLIGEHVYQIDGEPHRLIVSDVAVVPQPFGSFFRVVLNTEGMLINNELAQGRVGIVDIGTHTTDLVLVDELRYIEPGSGSVDVAMARALELIGRAIEDVHALALEIHQVDTALRKGYVTVCGERKDIGDLARPHLAAVAQKVLDKTTTLWGDGRDLSAVIVTGGGAYAMGEHVKARYPHAVILPNPERGNVEGFYRYGLRKWGRRCG